MPSEASEDWRGGAARGGAALPSGNNTFVPGFRNCCKKDPLRRGLRAQLNPWPTRPRGEGGPCRAGAGPLQAPPPAAYLGPRSSQCRRAVPGFQQLVHLLRSSVFRVPQPQHWARKRGRWVAKGLSLNSRSESRAGPGIVGLCGELDPGTELFLTPGGSPAALVGKTSF